MDENCIKTFLFGNDVCLFDRTARSLQEKRSSGGHAVLLLMLSAVSDLPVRAEV